MVTTNIKLFREMYKIRERFSKNRHNETLQRYNRIEHLVKLRNKLSVGIVKLKDNIATKRFQEKLILMDKFYRKQLDTAQRDIKKLKLKG